MRRSWTDNGSAAGALGTRLNIALALHCAGLVKRIASYSEYRMIATRPWNATKVSAGHRDAGQRKRPGPALKLR